MKRIKRLTVLLLLPALLLSLAPCVRADSGTKLAALTFDDGPGPYTEKLLDGLSERGVRATFFCLGSRAESYPDTVRRIVNEGHQLANHSYSHPDLNTLATSAALSQITRTDEILDSAAGGSEARYIRAPYGNSTQALRSKLDAPLIYWSVDTLDWKSRNAAKVQASIQAHIFDGAIILLHDIHPTTVDGVLAALDALEGEGYEFVTVKELFRRRGLCAENGVQYYSCKPSGTDQGAISAPEITAVSTAAGMEITISGPTETPIYYTLDGQSVSYDSACYSGPFLAELPCTVRAVAAWDLNGGRSEEASVTYTLPPACEPVVEVRDGKLYLTPGAEDETAWYALGGADPRQEGLPCDGLAAVPPDNWFSYCEGGEGRMPTPVRRLLLTGRGNLFADVDPGQWYYDAVDWAAAKGILQGRGEGMMDPDASLTRGMLVTILYRLDGAPDLQGQAPAQAYADVDSGAYYAEAVRWAQFHGIVHGYSETRFGPGDAISREQLAAILCRYAQYHGTDTASQSALTDYTDGSSVSPYAAEAMGWAVKQGILSGVGNGKLSPLGEASRAQVAASLMRLTAAEE